MSEELEYRCFIGGLSWSTSDRGLKAAFDKFGHLVEAKVIPVHFLGLSVSNDSSKESNNLPLFSVTSKGFSPLDLGKARLLHCESFKSAVEIVVPYVFCHRLLLTSSLDVLVDLGLSPLMRKMQWKMPLKK
ncbi:hypothetical protein C3L33_21175, partial [Rhododendron williamsianum]